MTKDFWTLLANSAGPGVLEKLSPSLKQRLQGLSDALAFFLGSADSATTADTLPKLCGHILSHLSELEHAAIKTNGSPQQGANVEHRTNKVDPEIMSWARQQMNEEEIVAGLREIRESGGLELKDFLHELEREAIPHE